MTATPNILETLRLAERAAIERIGEAARAVDAIGAASIEQALAQFAEACQGAQARFDRAIDGVLAMAQALAQGIALAVGDLAEQFTAGQGGQPRPEVSPEESQSDDEVADLEPHAAPGDLDMAQQNRLAATMNEVFGGDPARHSPAVVPPNIARAIKDGEDHAGAVLPEQALVAVDIGDLLELPANGRRPRPRKKPH